MQILLTVSYDGTSYAGWQRQKNAITVQEKLEDALTNLLCQPVTTKAASRTDAGVHALGQRAVFSVEKLHIPISKLPEVITSCLPKDISVTAAIAVPDSFNPRFGAAYKTYSYSLYNAKTPNPLLCRYSAFIPRSLDTKAMQEAAHYFIGRHDFAAFQATGSSAITTTREIFACDVKVEPANIINITVTGNAFLYNMVRIIAGTLLYVGLGKISAESVRAIILSCDRTKAGKTMPPEGLTLLAVGYTNYPAVE